MKFLKQRVLPLLKRKPVKITLIVLVLLAIAAFAYIKVAHGPAKGTISESSGNEQPATSEAQDYIRHDGHYVSFAYPESYRMEKGEDLPVSVLESYRLITPGKPGQPSRTVALTVYSLPNADPYEASAYKIRADSPQVYLKSGAEVEGKQITYFKKNDGSENVAFVRDGLKLAAIALSGAIASPPAVDDFEYTINSLEWL